MREKKVKAIRRQVYGDYSFRDRRYRAAEDGKSGGIECDPRRRAYQQMKKSHGRGGAL